MASKENSLLGRTSSDRERVPEILLGAVEIMGSSDRWFYGLFAPHLLGAFFKWEDSLINQGIPSEWMRENQLSIPYRDRMAYLRQGMHGVSNGWVDLACVDDGIKASNPREGIKERNEIFAADPATVIRKRMRNSGYLFYSDISAPKATDWTKDLVNHNYDLWLNQMLRPNFWEFYWRFFRVPFSIDFRETVHGLPSVIDCGEVTLELSFNRFYLPNFIRRPSYSQAFFNFLAASYEQIIPLSLKKEIFSQFFSFAKDGRILDLACGTGLAMDFKPENVSLIGLDTALEMVKAARRRGEEAYQMDVHKISLTNESMDNAIMSFGAFWVDDFLRVMREVNRVLKPSGIFVFNLHKASGDWQERYADLALIAGFNSVKFAENEIARTGELPYKALYVIAQK